MLILAGEINLGRRIYREGQIWVGLGWRCQVVLIRTQLQGRWERCPPVPRAKTCGKT
jgi:hypothetical protein